VTSDELLPVIGLRLLDGRVGSTLLMQLLATSSAVVCDREYPYGEYRYLSYCVRIAEWMRTPWDPERDIGVTDMMFNAPDRGGPLPWTPHSLSIDALGPRALRALWSACSTGFRDHQPECRWYAEKLACEVAPIVAAEIPIEVIEVVRDPRDIVASMLSFKEFGPAPGQRIEAWVAGLLPQWAAWLDAMSAPTQLRYEDFAPDLDQTAAILGARFEIDLDAASVARPDRHVTTSSIAESIGRWRRDLDPSLAKQVWDALDSWLVPLGYSAD
jgi:hypothetical protein